MKKAFVLLVTTLSALFSMTATAQSILQTYFKGNKDSMRAEATRLINRPAPAFRSVGKGLPGIAQVVTKQRYKLLTRRFVMRDKQVIAAFKLRGKSANTIVLIHGVRSSSYDYLETAHLVQQATQTTVYAVDLRGHGRSAGKPGDVAYVNQYADDLADVVAAIRREKPGGKVIIAGHSIGGGVALQYARNKQAPLVDGYLLMAPLLGQDSPAIRQDSAMPTDTTKPAMNIHITRIIGLKMLNELGQHEHDSLPVLYFNVPVSVPLRQYTYRANISMAPENYVRAVGVPLLVLVGSKDEVFVAKKLEKAVLDNSKGEVHLLEGATHDGIGHDPRIVAVISNWFSTL